MLGLGNPGRSSRSEEAELLTRLNLVEPSRHEDGKTVWVELVIRSGNSRGVGSGAEDTPSQQRIGRAVPTDGSQRSTAGAATLHRADPDRGDARPLAA
jgi:hypothetical protein